jgi:hypothetical protein
LNDENHVEKTALLKAGREEEFHFHYYFDFPAHKEVDFTVS